LRLENKPMKHENECLEMEVKLRVRA
jgi:hypothetical protein